MAAIVGVVLVVEAVRGRDLERAEDAVREMRCELDGRCGMHVDCRRVTPGNGDVYECKANDESQFDVWCVKLGGPIPEFKEVAPAELGLEGFDSWGNCRGGG